MPRLNAAFFMQEASVLAPLLLGKTLVRQLANGEIVRHIITETEAYCGTEDLACHASKGITPRTRVMFGPPGMWYVYLIYGMHQMLNVVCASEGNPHAVLIRGSNIVSGPGRLSKSLEVSKELNNTSILTSDKLWLEEGVQVVDIITTPRIGIDYAGDYWKNKPWRFVAVNKSWTSIS